LDLDASTITSTISFLSLAFGLTKLIYLMCYGFIWPSVTPIINASSILAVKKSSLKATFGCYVIYAIKIRIE
jgi:hypothetical protein